MINFSELLWKQERAEQRSPAVPEPVVPRKDAELAAVPRLKVTVGPESRIAMLGEAASLGADRFRYLRMRLREVRDLANLRTLLVTSPLAQDGKSTIILNLATTLAERGKKSVLVIEADLHRPSLGEKLGLLSNNKVKENGLAQCLEQERDPFGLLWKLEPLNWFLLPAGKPKDNPTELLQGERMGKLVQQMMPHFDWILIDSPPVLPLTDAALLSRYVDAGLLVVRAHQTPRDAVEQALNTLGKKHVLGVLFNAHDGVNKSYAKYGSYYGKQQ